MRIRRKENCTKGHPPFGNTGENGFVATTLFIALLVVMLMLATAGGAAILHLHDEVKVLEHQQIKRLEFSATNSLTYSNASVTREEKQ